MQTSGDQRREIAKPFFHPSYTGGVIDEAASVSTTPASTRQRNSGESGGGDSSGVQSVNFSSV
jgi:hypothetical protein